ncbi:MAG: hypothetical protein R3F20_13115 [Planctomycetota bacterium]
MRTRASLALLASLVLVAGAFGQDPHPAPKAEKTVYCAVQKNEVWQVVPKAEVAALKKRVAEEDKAALAAWESRKKEAAKAKKPFEEARPAKTVLKVGPKTFDSEAMAEAFIKSEREKAAKPKKGDKPAPKKPAKDKPRKPAKDKPAGDEPRS